LFYVTLAIAAVLTNFATPDSAVISEDSMILPATPPTSVVACAHLAWGSKYPRLPFVAVDVGQQDKVVCPDFYKF
jgi:hypothetical protein